jgi:NAD-dependent deacetylase
LIDEKIEKLQKIIDNAKRIVFFGGAGVSTESGIPDFRSVDGLYNQKYDFPPEEILSHTFFKKNTAEFYKFYRDKMLVLDVQPNAAHRKIAELEKSGKLIGVVTQNIDGLHQLAGSKNVYELHGSIHRNYCVKCGKFYSAKSIFECTGVPMCECGGIIKPDVVLYEESLNDRVVEGAIRAISSADLLIIGGTSLSVYPASGFIRYFRGDKIAIINKAETFADGNADLLINDAIGKVLSKINVKA